MQRTPIGLYLLFSSAAVLSIWMALDGLMGRVLGSFLPFFGRPGLWLAIPSALGTDPSAFAWPLVVIGTSWSGALMAMAMRISWGAKAARTLALLSLLYLGPGTLLGLVVLVSLSSPVVSTWLREQPLVENAKS